MIYLVTKVKAFFKSSKYECISIKRSKEIINSMKKIRGLDTETMGLNPHTKALLTIQIGTKENQVVIAKITIKSTNGTLSDKKSENSDFFVHISQNRLK